MAVDNGKFYMGVNNVAGTASKIYIGINNKAKLVYDGTGGGAVSTLYVIASNHNDPYNDRITYPIYYGSSIVPTNIASSFTFTSITYDNVANTSSTHYPILTYSYTNSPNYSDCREGTEIARGSSVTIDTDYSYIVFTVVSRWSSRGQTASGGRNYDSSCCAQIDFTN